MNGKETNVKPPTGPFFPGTFTQRRAIARWENAGWIFVHWTEIPEMVAVLQSVLGDVIFIDQKGWAWEGPAFGKKKLVPLEKYPLATALIEF